MSVPAKRKSRRTKKSSYIFPKKNQLINCPDCKKKIIPHRACPYCGKYAGEKILNIKIKSKKTAKK